MGTVDPFIRSVTEALGSGVPEVSVIFPRISNDGWAPGGVAAGCWAEASGAAKAKAAASSA